MSQISTPPEAVVKPTGRGNRRVTIRYRCAPATIGKVYLHDDLEYQHACVYDLSARGVGLQIARPLDLGQLLVIIIRSNDGSKSYELAARVAHCSLQPQGDWFVGCELSVTLTPEDLDLLL